MKTLTHYANAVRSFYPAQPPTQPTAHPLPIPPPPLANPFDSLIPIYGPQEDPSTVLPPISPAVLAIFEDSHAKRFFLDTLANAHIDRTQQKFRIQQITKRDPSLRSSLKKRSISTLRRLQKHRALLHS